MKFKIFFIDKKNYSILFLLTIPVILNFLISFSEEFKFAIIKNFLGNLPLTILFFFFFVLIGFNIKNIFKFQTISFSIATFFMILFVLDNVFLFLTRYLSFKQLANIYLFIFLIIFLYRQFKIKNLRIANLFLVAFYLFFQKFNNSFYLGKDLFTSDESRLWIPATTFIYENNYFFSLKNISIEGYGLLPAYIKAFLTSIFNYSSFVYNPVISNLFLLLFLLMVIETFSKVSSKIYIILLFISIFFTNDWLNYIFFNSLLGEGPSSFVFSTIIIEIMKSKNKISNFPVVLLAFNIYGKNFLTIISLLLIIFLYVKFKNKKNILIFLMPLSVTYLNYIIFDISYLWKFYFEFNSGYGKNNFVAINNLNLLIREFLVDKTMSILFLSLFTLWIFSKNKINKILSLDHLNENILYLNIFIVVSIFILLVEEGGYIGDSYRYLVSTLFLIPSIFSNYLEQKLY